MTDAVLGELDLSLKDVVLEYGDHLGRPGLRQIVAGDGGVTPDDVLMTIGAAAALFIVNTSLLRAGDRMVVLHPNYATNVETTARAGRERRHAAVALRGRLPAGPEGAGARADAGDAPAQPDLPAQPDRRDDNRRKLEQIVRPVEAHGSYLLFGKTYPADVWRQAAAAASLSPHAISVCSLSKTYGLPGIRMGWLVNRDPALMETFLAAKEQIFVSGSVGRGDSTYLGGGRASARVPRPNRKQPDRARQNRITAAPVGRPARGRRSLPYAPEAGLPVRGALLPNPRRRVGPSAGPPLVLRGPRISGSVTAGPHRTRWRAGWKRWSRHRGV